MKKSLAFLLAAMMLLTLVTGCGSKEPSADPGTSAEATEERTVVVCSDAIFTTLNFLSASGYGDKFFGYNIYECLALPGKDGGMELQLAESYEVSDDGLTYTFKLPSDVKFHNGDTLKASDVAWSINVYAREFPIIGSYVANIKDVKVIDDTTVAIELTQPDSMTLSNLINFPIHNQAFVESQSDRTMSMVECGTGPYKVVDFNGTDRCLLEAFSDYHAGEPEIKSVEFRYISDTASSAVAFESGDIDVLSAPIAQGKLMMESGKYNSQIATMPHTAMIIFNTTKAPFDNKLVRQALSYAADKQTIIQIAYDGMAKEARLLADPDAVAGADMSKADDISYNPEKAKALLAEAGYPDGLDLTAMGIEFKTIAGGYHEKIAQVYQQNLAAIGVKVELVSTETPDEDAVAGDYYFMNEGQSFKPDFAYNIRQYSSDYVGGTNMAQWSDEYVTEEFNRINAITDTEERQASYADLIAYIVDACPNLPIMHRQKIWMTQPDLNAYIYEQNDTCFRVWEWSWNS